MINPYKSTILFLDHFWSPKVFTKFIFLKFALYRLIYECMYDYAPTGERKILIYEGLVVYENEI